MKEYQRTEYWSHYNEDGDRSIKKSSCNLDYNEYPMYGGFMFGELEGEYLTIHHKIYVYL